MVVAAASGFFGFEGGQMRLEDLKVSMRVQIVNRDMEGGRLYLMPATVLSIYCDRLEVADQVSIRLVYEDGSGLVRGGFQPEDLDFE